MISVEDVKNILPCEVVVGNNLDLREVKGCYIGDLPSWVMDSANQKDIWVTVLGDVNSIAVAKLADISCIILADNSQIDINARQKAIEQGIPIIKTHLSSYKVAIKIYKLFR